MDDVEREVDSLYRQNADDGCLQSDIQQAMSQLKPAERTCITLFYMEDRQIREIADIMGLPEGTVKSHLSRGKDKMTTYLKENGYG